MAGWRDGGVPVDAPEESQWLVRNDSGLIELWEGGGVEGSRRWARHMPLDEARAALDAIGPGSPPALRNMRWYVCDHTAYVEPQFAGVCINCRRRCDTFPHGREYCKCAGCDTEMVPWLPPTEPTNKE